LVNNYFSYYPEKKAIYDKRFEERTAKVKVFEEYKKKISEIDDAIAKLNKEIQSYEQESKQLEKKIFGKAKAQQKIADNKLKIADCEEELKSLEGQKDTISNDSITVESKRDFYLNLMDEFDNFVAWHWVGGIDEYDSPERLSKEGAYQMVFKLLHEKKLDEAIELAKKLGNYGLIPQILREYSQYKKAWSVLVNGGDLDKVLKLEENNRFIRISNF